MKAVGYARISVASGNGDSLDAQADALAAWAKRERHDLVAVHQDAGLSGTLEATERAGLAAAFGTLGASAELLVVHRLDRLARELHVQEAILAKAWSLGARVFSAVDGEILQDDPDDPMRKFVRQVMGAAAELERGMVVARMQGGRRRKRMQGRHIGGSRPYGYELVEDDEGHRLEPLPVEQKVIIRMRRLRGRGKSFAAVAAVLNRDRVPSPGGGLWYPASVRRVVERSWVTS